MTQQENTHLGFLVFPGFPMACLTSMIEPLRVANEITGRDVFQWTLVSETGARVEASARVWFDPDLPLQSVEKLDQLFLLSDPVSRFVDPVRSEGKLRKLARYGVTLGAISGGVFPLARSGLLDGHRASVHWCYETAFAAEFPMLSASADVIVIDRQRLTASGAGAAFDLTLQLIENKLGARVATEVACWFQHPMMRGQGVTQRKPTFAATSTSDMLPPQVARVVQIFSDHIEDPIQIAEAAHIVGVSVRQLERMFQKATGATPLGYYRTLRMHKARQLLRYGKDTLLQVAMAVGYSSTTAMAKSYREVFGVHPSEERNKINMFRVHEGAAV